MAIAYKFEQANMAYSRFPFFGALMIVASTIVPPFMVCPVFHHHTIDCFEKQFIQAMPFQQITELAPCRFVRHIYCEKVDLAEFAYCIAVVDRILCHRIR